MLNIINGVLDEKEVVYQEKYLIDLKNSELSNVIENGTEANIVQTYLVSSEGEEKRLRMMRMGDNISYYYSVYKRNDDGSKFIVSEKRIDRNIYNSLLEFRDNNSVDIKKKRYYFVYEGSYLHLDIFDGDEELGMLEINVNKGGKCFVPEYLRVIDIVTGNEEYVNHSLAKKRKLNAMVKKYD